MLKAQLERDPDWTGRAGAAHALGKEGSYESIEALGTALLKDTFWGAAVEIAAALGENGSLQARDALVAALSIENPKARRAVVKALGGFRDEAAAKALAPLAKHDASYFVEAEANLALGATGHPSAFAVLSASAKKESHGDVIREFAYAGLARLRDDRAVAILKAGAAPGGLPKGRMSAMRSLASLAKGRDPLREEARSELEEYLRDPDFFAKMGALAALDLLGESASAQAAENLRNREVDGRLALNSRDVARRLRESTAKSDEVTSLRSDFEKLREENRSLRDRIEKLEKFAPPPHKSLGSPRALPKPKSKVPKAKGKKAGKKSKK